MCKNGRFYSVHHHTDYKLVVSLTFDKCYNFIEYGVVYSKLLNGQYQMNLIPEQ